MSLNDRIGTIPEVTDADYGHRTQSESRVGRSAGVCETAGNRSTDETVFRWHTLGTSGDLTRLGGNGLLANTRSGGRKNSAPSLSDFGRRRLSAKETSTTVQAGLLTS
ncbi:MAG: hypothetical protein KDA89_12550, partial [Planctomycetaceae bacterium]|nr:hypothetical protein [Planctomycetaceae bacterium]